MHPKGLIVTDIIGADIPDLVSETELFELVKTFQGHQFSGRYKKYRNDKCRFHFENFFTSSTSVAETLSDDMSKEIKIQVLKNCSALLSKIRRYI